MTLKWHFCDRVNSIHLSAVLELIQGLEPVEYGLLQIDTAHVKASVVISDGKNIRAVTFKNGKRQLAGWAALTRLLSVEEGQFFYKEANSSDLLQIDQNIDLPLPEVLKQLRFHKEAEEALKRKKESVLAVGLEVYCGDHWLTEELELYCGDNWLTERPTSSDDIEKVVESPDATKVVNQTIQQVSEVVDLPQPVAITTANVDVQETPSKPSAVEIIKTLAALEGSTSNAQAVENAQMVIESSSAIEASNQLPRAEPEVVDLAQRKKTTKADAHKQRSTGKLSAADIINTLVALEGAIEAVNQLPAAVPEVVDLSERVKTAKAHGHKQKSSSKLLAGDIITALELLEQAAQSKSSEHNTPAPQLENELVPSLVSSTGQNTDTETAAEFIESTNAEKGKPTINGEESDLAAMAIADPGEAETEDSAIAISDSVPTPDDAEDSSLETLAVDAERVIESSDVIEVVNQSSLPEARSARSSFLGLKALKLEEVSAKDKEEQKELLRSLKQAKLKFYQEDATPRQICALAGIVLILTILAYGVFTVNSQTVREHMALGQNYLKEGKPNCALEEFTQAVSDSNSPSAYIARGEAFLIAGQPQNALNDFDNAAKAAPFSIDVLCGQGAAYHALQNDDAALSKFQVAIAKYGNLPEPYRQRGMLFLDVHDDVRAFDDFKQAIEKGLRQSNKRRLRLSCQYPNEKRVLGGGSRVADKSIVLS